MYKLGNFDQIGTSNVEFISIFICEFALAFFLKLEVFILDIQGSGIQICCLCQGPKL